MSPVSGHGPDGTHRSGVAPRPSPTRRSPILVGLAVGLALGAALSAAVAIQAALTAGHALRELGLPLWQAAGGYLLMGSASGLIVGLAWPLRRWALGAMLVGFLACVPVWFLGFVVLGGSIRHSVWPSLELSAAFGLPIGFYVWYLVRHYRPS